VCNCAVRRSQATRDTIARATSLRQISRTHDFSRKTAYSVEVPINEGFLRRHEFHRDKKIRRDRDHSRQIFSCTTLPARPTLRCKKFFAQNAFSGVSKHPMRRKTRESAPSDSL
jgi:hypothetical protein